MKCRHCKSPLLDGEESCYRCGRAVVEVPLGTRYRPAALTALSLLGLAVALAALVAALWLALPPGAAGLGRPLWALIPAGYAVLRLRGAWDLWHLQPSGRTLQTFFAYTEFVLFPFGTVLSLLTLLYLGRDEIRALFREHVLEDLAPPQRQALRETRHDSAVLASVAAVCAGLALAAVSLLWAGHAGVRRAAAEAELEFPHCREEPDVSTAFTERWRFPLDRPDLMGTPDPSVSLSVDPDVSARGGSSVRIESGRPATVWLATVPAQGLRLDGGSLFYRARILDRDLDGEVTLGLRFSDSGPGPLSEQAPRGLTTRGWREGEVAYIPSPGEESADLFPLVLIYGTGTVWIDDVRLLRGPPWTGGLEWRRTLDEERGRRPGTGVEALYEVLTGGDEDAIKALAAVYSAPPAGAVPPDRVQKCLTELVLFYSRRDGLLKFSMGERLRRDLVGSLSGRRLRPSPWIWRFRPAVYSYHQPEYLADLVRHAPDEALVATYGRDVVPHLLGHAEELMEPSPDLRSHARRMSGGGTLGENFFLWGVIGSEPAVAVAAMVSSLLDREQAGELRLAPDERAGLRDLLEGYYENVRRDAADALLSPKYDPLLLVLGRLDSERLGATAAALVERRLHARVGLAAQLADLHLLAGLRPPGGREILQSCRERVEDPEVQAYLDGLLEAWERRVAALAPPQKLAQRLDDAPPLDLG